MLTGDVLKHPESKAQETLVGQLTLLERERRHHNAQPNYNWDTRNKDKHPVRSLTLRPRRAPCL